MVTSSLDLGKKSTTRRLQELDAIRGIAATIVVFHHYLLTQIDNYTVVSNHVRRFLQLIEPIWGGHAAVLLFFVLSGLVLALPYLNGKPQPYSSYLVRRIFRIYVPYLAALALALTGDYFLHQHLQGMSHWSTETWSEPIQKGLVLQHIFMLGSYDSGQFNTAFWTLVHEMRISIVYPFLLIAVVRLRARTALALSFLVSLGSVFAMQRWPLAPHLQTTHLLATLHYMAFFVCGILVAKNLHAIGDWYRRQNRAIHGSLVIASILLYGYSPILIDHLHSYRMMGDWILGAGAVGIIVLGVHSQHTRDLLNLTPPRYLGRVSYSLYLVHGTALFVLMTLLHGKIPFLVILPIYLFAAFAGSFLFCKFIEEPAMRFGKQITSRRSKLEPVPEPMSIGK